MEHGCGFDRSQLHSDEGPPIGQVGSPSPCFVADLATWLLRWN